MLKCNQSKDGNCIALRNFNGYVGSSIDGNQGVHGGQGIRWLVTRSSKKEKKNSKKLLFTFKSGGNSSVIDYVEVKKGNERYTGLTMLFTTQPPLYRFGIEK